MKQIIGFCDFQDTFRFMDRSDNFSYEGKKALFEYLEEYEEATGEEIELDIIALCCEYTEYESIEEFQQNYGTDYECIEDIQDVAQVIDIDGASFIVQDF